jgi:hypothetical protein
MRSGNRRETDDGRALFCQWVDPCPPSAYVPEGFDDACPHDNYFDDVVPDECDLDDLDNADLYCVHVYLSLRISVYVLVNLSMVPFCLASLLYFAPLPSFE